MLMMVEARLQSSSSSSSNRRRRSLCSASLEVFSRRREVATTSRGSNQLWPDKCLFSRQGCILHVMEILSFPLPLSKFMKRSDV
ncbi:hypothetical protein OIU77_004460 [Salix suchowensis]|uniref:Uncharacterized protein n=1 Tax=Salix suchowensis TaxID=1278906 RepID=A0ABQ9AUF8_9ROSI|nr:hypothetical protein OIU77_004460 [Salix suchowensis]